MTIEDFAHRCLMIKAGNTELLIPCCVNCKYYIPEDCGGIRELTSSYNKYNCKHPALESDVSFVPAWLATKPEDFCSKWEARDGLEN